MALPDLDAAIYSKLTGTAAITALVSTRVYAMLAPSGADLPYIVFYLGSGQIPNRTPQDTFDYVYRFDCWAETRATAEDIDQAVYDALHEQTLTLTGWSNYRMQCTTEQRFIETFEGQQYHRYVWDVRIRSSRN